MRVKKREITDMKDILKIVKKCTVCRIAMVDGQRPYVIPLNFGYTESGGALTLYFHSATEGRKLDILVKNNNVCFEMDCVGELSRTENPCRSGYPFESVIGSGQVRFIEDEREKCEALAIFMRHQTGDEITFTPKQAQGVCIYKVTADEICGKRRK